MIELVILSNMVCSTTVWPVAWSTMISVDVEEDTWRVPVFHDRDNGPAQQTLVRTVQGFFRRLLAQHLRTHGHEELYDLLLTPSSLRTDDERSRLLFLSSQQNSMSFCMKGEVCTTMYEDMNDHSVSLGVERPDARVVQNDE